METREGGHDQEGVMEGERVEASGEHSPMEDRTPLPSLLFLLGLRRNRETDVSHGVWEGSSWQQVYLDCHLFFPPRR